MEWKIEYLKEAQRDLKRLDPYNRKLILKAIEKMAERPLPPPDGIGKPLGNHAGSKLSGFYKIKLRGLGYRIVYQLVQDGGTIAKEFPVFLLRKCQKIIFANLFLASS